MGQLTVNQQLHNTNQGSITNRLLLRTARGLQGFLITLFHGLEVHRTPTDGHIPPRCLVAMNQDVPVLAHILLDLANDELPIGAGT